VYVGLGVCIYVCLCARVSVCLKYVFFSSVCARSVCVHVCTWFLYLDGLLYLDWSLGCHNLSEMSQTSYFDIINNNNPLYLHSINIVYMTTIWIIIKTNIISGTISRLFSINVHITFFLVSIMKLLITELLSLIKIVRKI